MERRVPGRLTPGLAEVVAVQASLLALVQGARLLNCRCLHGIGRSLLFSRLSRSLLFSRPSRSLLFSQLSCRGQVMDGCRLQRLGQLRQLLLGHVASSPLLHDLRHLLDDLLLHHGLQGSGALSLGPGLDAGD